jgi:hypothetical protein
MLKAGDAKQAIATATPPLIRLGHYLSKTDLGINLDWGLGVGPV